MFPKILFIEIAHHFGGSGARLLTILRNIPMGSVGLACLSDSETGKKAKQYGIKVHIIGRSKLDPGIFFRLIRLLREEEYAIFDTQNINSKIWGAAISRFTDAIFVSTINSNYLQEFSNPFKRWIINTTERLTNSRVAKYIAVSHEVREGLEESGIPGAKIKMITNGIQIDAAKISSDNKLLDETIKRKKKYHLAVSVGRLVWIKGHDVLINAINIVRINYPDFICIIIGDGPAEPELQKLIEHFGLEESVFLTGFLPLEQTHSMVRQSDMFIMPSRTEGTPMALLEAAALSRPIIATNVGGIPDVISPNIDGLLVNPENAEEIATAIMNLIENPQLSDEFGARVKQKVDSEYSPQVQVEKLLSAYQEAIGENNS